ncbi:L-lysine 2,3-aminomutase [Sphaerulina musiva SO2202]|uniref:L-lysine 2,3-aminomutase n=1 Tax=Sphaerulina musiva (strain SO2202) TaxID=692275 RepID=N1QID9_SPHMS|nr:L-lysine 2,3-aminomutase [Sphaerulina musiva SO2202]EMF16955.1 L-lysine 2,3-aminomutase [Sphaerulina musiva SO2202]
MALKVLSKSSIPSIFRKHCPSINHLPYLAAAQVFPMRVNSHVVNNLIDWSKVPHDPIFRMTFPHPDMLQDGDREKICSMLLQHASRLEIRRVAEHIRKRLNPHPAGQQQENIPRFRGKPVFGMQHKYRETVLFFPLEGQYCHAYCSYCFRWAQFTSVGSPQTFQSNSRTTLPEYIRAHPSVTDVLFTGGDPLIMSTKLLQTYILPLLPQNHGPRNLKTIRIGTKALTWWPRRFLDDGDGENDAKQLLRLLEDIVASGIHVSIQAHVSHARELLDPDTQAAIRALRSTGAVIRCQAPLMRHVNDSASAWADMWRLQTSLGTIPYYMFVERDTGAADYFAVPLTSAFEIYSTASSMVSGLSRTARGPSMSTSPGKICVRGIETISQQKVFVLQFVQSRNPQWCHRTFFAEYDSSAVWFDQLKPAFGEEGFFFESEYEEIRARAAQESSGQIFQG